MTKMYNIVDMQGNYYKIGAKGNLVAAKNSGEADMFTLREANNRIGGGKKARFYTTVEADMRPVSEAEPTYSAPEYDEVEKPSCLQFSIYRDVWYTRIRNGVFSHDS